MVLHTLWHILAMVSIGLVSEMLKVMVFIVPFVEPLLSEMTCLSREEIMMIN